MPELLAPRNQFIGRPVEVRPSEVARCASTSDVVAALSRAGTDFAVRSGGHSNADYSSTPGLLVDVSPLAGVEVGDGVVTVGGGVRIGQLAAVLAPLGRLVPGGSCPSVGLVGSAMGGGFGSHGRRHGLTCDSWLSAEVVLATGEVVTASETESPDLFWALRGAGGGNFGVVTSAVFRTVPAERRTHVRLSWPADPDVLTRWLALRQPEDVSLEAVLLCPDHPDDIPTVSLVGAVPAADALTPFLAGLPDPLVAEVVPVTAEQAALLHPTPYSAVAHDPPEIPLVHDRPGMTTARTEFFTRSLPPAAVAALVAHVTRDRVFGELREVSFTPWGAAYARVPPYRTAFAHRQARYLVKHTVLVGPNGAARRGAEALSWLSRGWSITHPWGTGGAYVNFPDPDLPDHLAAYHGTQLPALRTVKSRYDPDNVFHFPQSIR